MLVFGLNAQEPRFGVQAPLVIVPVAVTDAKGRSIDELDAKDFVVLDNGRPQKATLDTMATGVAPIALVIGVQASGISKAVLDKVRKIGAMIQPLVTGERGCAAVVAFSERIDWLQECSADADAIPDALERIRPGEEKGGHMLDAVNQSIERLGKHPNSRRVLLLISESRDRGSETALDQVLVAAQRSGVTVYAATYSAFKTAWTTRASATGEAHPPKVPKNPSEQTGTTTGGPPARGPAGCPVPPVPVAEQRVDLLGGIGELVRMGQTNTTQALTQATGGATFPFTRLKGLQEAIEKLGADLNSQYVLTFEPDNRTAGYHNLEIKIGGRDYLVRARPGYWAGLPTP